MAQYQDTEFQGQDEAKTQKLYGSTVRSRRDIESKNDGYF